MPWGKYEPLQNASPGNMKNLNDMLRYLFTKVQGNLTRRELSSSLRDVIDSKAEAAQVNELGETVGEHASLIQQNAAQISLKVSQTAYDGEKPYTGNTPPESPPVGRLWLDTSVTPNLLKRWDGNAWATAGAETLKTAGVDITAGSVQIDGAAVGFDTQNFSVNIKDPDDADISRMSMDGNGLSTGKINADILYTGPTYQSNAAPSFTGARASRLPPVTYTGWVNQDGSDSDFGIWSDWGHSKRTVQGMLDALPKFFDGAEVIVYLFPGSNFDSFVIDGFYGSGKLTVRTHTSDVNVKANVPNIVVSRCSITVLVEEIAATAVGISNCKDVEINQCRIDNSTSCAIGIDIQKSAVCVQSCEINVYHGIWLRVLSRALLINNVGDCTYYTVARSGSEIRFIGTGAYSADNSFDEAANYFGAPVGTHGSGYTPPPTPPTQTVQIALLDSRSYRASPTNQWYADHTIGYGEYDPYGIWTGCMRFDLSALAGKTVVSARLRLYRRPNVGSSANETITVQTYTSPATLPAGNTSGGAPTRAGSGASASIPRGVPTWMDISAADVQAIIDGTAAGLCLNTGGSGYGKCDGLGDATPALLEVTYQ